MGEEKTAADRLGKLAQIKWLMFLLWTLVFGCSLLINVLQHQSETMDLVKKDAGMALENAVLARHWNASFGGVYVPVSPTTQPNPYLKIDERDITTPLGKNLTLMNPAFMTRQLFKLAEKEFGYQGRLVSLDPIRPANAADNWEGMAIKAFDRGETEVSTVEDQGDQKQIRLMRPLTVEQSCLACHAEQGFKVGEKRGGISIRMPVAQVEAITAAHLWMLVVGHGLLWILGLVGINIGARNLRLEMKKTRNAQNQTALAHLELNQIFKAEQDALAIIDKSCHVLRSNIQFQEIFALTISDVSGQFCHEILRFPMCKGPKCPLESVFEKGEAREFTFERVLEDQSMDIRVKVTPLTDDQGNVTSMLMGIRDLTREKALEKNLKGESSKLTTILLGVDYGVLIVDAGGMVLDVNPIYCDVLGKRKNYIEGTHLYENHVGAVAEKIDAVIKEFRKDTSSKPRELSGVLSYPEWIMRLSPVYREGAYDGVLIYAIDPEKGKP